MNPSVYVRPNKRRRLIVKERSRGTLPVPPIVNPVLRVSKETQCHVTPSGVADLMVSYLEATHSMPILEPHAGTGNLIQALLCDGHSPSEIVAIEQSFDLWAFMQNRMTKQNITIQGRNQCFLEYAQQEKIGFPRILMNPPFSRNSTDRHIKTGLSLLNTVGYEDALMVALVPSNYSHPDAIELDFLPSGTFPTTGISTKIIRFDKWAAN